MQERKNKRLLILLVVLVGTITALIWFGNQNATIDINKDLFKDYDLKTVDKIELQSPVEKVELTYNGSRWKVNERYNTDPEMIDVLFATLLQAEPKRPVAPGFQDSVGRALHEKGVKVSLWSNENIVETFYAGGNESKTEAYFKKINNEEVYIMAIPGYRVYIPGIFEVKERGWRDKYVFGFNWQNFQSLEVRFTKPSDDYTVVMDRQYPGIKGVSATDTAKLNDFLDKVSLLTVDEYVPTTPFLDSLGATQSLVHIVIRDIGKREYNLKLYVPGKSRQFYGQLNDGQWAVFSGNKVNGILRPKEFFIRR